MPVQSNSIQSIQATPLPLSLLACPLIEQSTIRTSHHHSQLPLYLPQPQPQPTKYHLSTNSLSCSTIHQHRIPISFPIPIHTLASLALVPTPIRNAHHVRHTAHPRASSAHRNSGIRDLSSHGCGCMDSGFDLIVWHLHSNYSIQYFVSIHGSIHLSILST